MAPTKPAGRMVGLLLLAQLAGLIVPFVMLKPLASADFLETAAASASQVKVAIALLFLTGTLTVAVSLALWPLLRQHSEVAGLLLLAAGVVVFTLQAVDNAHLLSMMSLSQQYAGDGSQGSLLDATAAAVRSTRRWVHYTTLFSIDLWIMTLYGLLYSFALVPRGLAFVGAATVVLHFSGIVLPFYLGLPAVVPLGMTMAAGHLALVCWLMTKGFSGVAPAKPFGMAGV